MTHQLPLPDKAALQITESLQKLINERIAEADGWLPFSEYMNLALYTPGLGYYAAGSRKFGPGGDFVTAPELSAVFSRCLAGQVAELNAQLRAPVVLELGAGSGAMAAELLLELERLDALPGKYLILELSADLRDRQAALIAERAPHLLSLVDWLDELPSRKIRGVIVCNEVVDALPFDIFHEKPQGLHERGVTSANGQLQYLDKPATFNMHALISRLSAQVAGRDNWPGHFCSEIRPALDGWFESVAEVLEQGAMLFVDYGASRRELYRGERSSGSLQCFFRHRVHDDPFWYPGLQDITAWVDFTQLAENAVANGLQVAGYTPQAQFLMHAGLDRQLEDNGASSPQELAELSAAVRKLMMPGEMGEVFKLMLFTTIGVERCSGFSGRDLRAGL